MDRLREPGDFSKAAGSNAETPGYQLQAVQGNSSSMAKTSKDCNKRSRLSAFSGGCSNRQSGFRCGWSSRTAEHEERLHQSAVRQLFAALAGGERVPAPWERDKCSTVLTLTKLIFRLKRSRRAIASS